jgi:hypothetical protein
VLRVFDKALSAMGIANKAFSLPVGAWFEDGTKDAQVCWQFIQVVQLF